LKEWVGRGAAPTLDRVANLNNVTFPPRLLRFSAICAEKLNNVAAFRTLLRFPGLGRT
jgi:hypothetical protein